MNKKKNHVCTVDDLQKKRKKQTGFFLKNQLLLLL